MGNLLLITGAGASYDVASSFETNVRKTHQPPLTNSLFNSGESQEIVWVRDCLAKHPVAAQVGRDWKTTGKPLEEYLSSLQSMKTVGTVQSQYFAVPIYLQELFSSISTSFIVTSKPGVPSNYVSLINAVAQSSFTTIIWLNLNYDLLADFAIKHTTRNIFQTFSDYMNIKTKENKDIKYTKPHGSVDWFRLNTNRIPWDQIINGDIPDNFEGTLSKEIYTTTSANRAGFNIINTQLYPAILAPVGKYDYVYEEHINTIKPDLEKVTSILCIGFSALDKDILDLIKLIPPIDDLKIVNGTHDLGREAYARIDIHCSKLFSKIGNCPYAFNGGFTKFVNTEMLKWLGKK